LQIYKSDRLLVKSLFDDNSCSVRN